MDSPHWTNLKLKDFKLKSSPVADNRDILGSWEQSKQLEKYWEQAKVPYLFPLNYTSWKEYKGCMIREAQETYKVQEVPETYQT